MKVLARGLALTGALCGLTFGLAACGSSSSSSSGSNGGTSSSGLKPAIDGSNQNLTDGKKGGALTVYDHEDFEHLDPGQTYFSIDYEVVYPTQRALYQFKPSSTTELMPDMAASAPTISNGGTVVKVKL